MDMIREFLSNDDGLRLLKTINRMNPMCLSIDKVSTIKDVSVAMNMPLKETWKLINEAYTCGLVMFYGGLLSKKRVDLTDLGERFTECTTPADIKEVLNNAYCND